MLKQGFEPRRSALDRVYIWILTTLSSLQMVQNTFLSMTFVVGIRFDIFKIGTTAGPEAIELVIKRPFFHLDLGPVPRDFGPLVSLCPLLCSLSVLPLCAALGINEE